MSARFAIPDVLQHRRSCRDCGDPWLVLCAFGAEEPPRDPYYRCPDCRTPPAEATPELVARIESRRAQMTLVKDDERG